jgi:hypothetical protein
MKSLCSVVSASKVVASDWMEGSVAVSAFRKRCSVIERILTDVIARHRRTLTLAKWEEGKKVFE